MVLFLQNDIKIGALHGRDPHWGLCYFKYFYDLSDVCNSNMLTMYADDNTYLFCERNIKQCLVKMQQINDLQIVGQ